MAQGRLRFTESGSTRSNRSMASTDRSKFRVQLSSSYDYDCLFKLLICGDSGVGKTSVLVRFVSNKFRVANICTKGVDFMMKHTVVQDKKVQLQIWDTAGQEEFNSITEQYFRRAEGILLVYDIANKTSFDNLNMWMEKLRQKLNAKVPIVLLGNKVDLEDKRQIAREQGLSFAEKENLPFFETSCLSSVNITEAIHHLVEMMLKVKLIPEPEPIPEPESIPGNESGPNSTVTTPDESKKISLPQEPIDNKNKKAKDEKWCQC